MQIRIRIHHDQEDVLPRSDLLRALEGEGMFVIPCICRHPVFPSAPVAASRLPRNSDVGRNVQAIYVI